jgi:hypothetical protein
MSLYWMELTDKHPKKDQVHILNITYSQKILPITSLHSLTSSGPILLGQHSGEVGDAGKETLIRRPARHRLRLQARRAGYPDEIEKGKAFHPSTIYRTYGARGAPIAGSPP